MCKTIKRKYIFISFFIFIIIILNMQNVFGVSKSGIVSTTEITATYETKSSAECGGVGSKWADDSKNANNQVVIANMIKFSSIMNTITTNYCKRMQEIVDNNFEDLALVDSYSISGTYYIEEYDRDDTGKIVGSHAKAVVLTNETSLITNPENLLDILSRAGSNTMGDKGDFQITFKIRGTEIEYTFYTYSSTVFMEDSNKPGYVKEVTRENYANLQGLDDKVKSKHINAMMINQNTVKMCELFQGAANEGIIAGSISAGYNIATPYMTKQTPLDTIMEYKGRGYTFIEGSGVKYSVSYYYSPLFGKLFALQDPKIPESRQGWLDLAASKPDYINSDGSLKVDDGFMAYRTTLSEDDVNSMGEKIDEITVDGGVTSNVFSVGGAKKPLSVISYNTSLAVPYLWSITNGIGSMVLDSNRVLESYIYNLYTDRIYPYNAEGTIDKTSEIAKMTSDNIADRGYLYLYNKIKNSEEENSKPVRVGVVIVGDLHEAIMDTSQNENSTSTDVEGKIYLTGRHLRLLNGYSDYLDFNNKNIELLTLSEVGGVSNGVEPYKFSFPVKDLELSIYTLYEALAPEVEQKAPEMTQKVKDFVQGGRSKADLLNYTLDRNNHIALPSTCKVSMFLIDFGNITRNKEAKKVETNVSGQENEEGTDGNLYEDSKFAFYVIRNNYYIQDSSLIDWLRSDKAKSISYVNSSELLSKIQGNFTENLNELSYETWKEMQHIKKELEFEKSNIWIRVLNVTSIVFGVILIIFGILFLLAYWIDIFNTLVDFSILQFISFGNLYPVADKDSIPYIAESKGNIKYVLFRHVLIISLIMFACGILFMNVSFIVTIIINIYNYIMFVLNSL